MQTASKNNSANTLASVLMINAQGIMLSVLGHDYSCSFAFFSALPPGDDFFAAARIVYCCCHNCFF